MNTETVDPYTDVEDAVLADRSAGPGGSLLQRGHDAFRSWPAPAPSITRFVCTPTVLTDVLRTDFESPGAVR